MPINESRDASTEHLLTHVLRLFDSCPPEIKTKIIRFAIEKSQEGMQTLENSLYWSQSRRPDAWGDAFRRAFPDHVLCSFSDAGYQSMIRLGRKAVRATRESYRLLSGRGVQTAEKVLRAEEEGQRQVFEPDGILKENYERAVPVLEYALRHCCGGTTRLTHLPKNLAASAPGPQTLDEIVVQAQRTAIENALEQTGGKVAEAALLLGRNEKGLYRLMRTLEMPVKRRE